MTAPLTWNDIRGAANAFVAEWQGESRERAEKDSFWNDFFAVFGVSRRRVAVFEQLADRQSTGRHGFMDCFWPGQLAVEHKSLGENLDEAMAQLLDYLPGLPDDQLPRMAVVCDFATFKVHDFDSGDGVTFALTELPRHLERFGFIAGYERHGPDVTEEDVNLRATALLADLHDALKDSGYSGHPLRVFLVRLLFVLFADDTGVWERGLFNDYITLKTSPDGRDLGSALNFLFQVLDTPENQRASTLDEDLAAFTYVNGGVFEETLRTPACDRGMRTRLLKASSFNWAKISPAIFGSLFQNVMEPAERRNLGAHYTTEENILRTIEPLFLDALRKELAAAKSLKDLRGFRDRLGTMKFLDPACGCGNFLVIAYREVRRLELQCQKRIRTLEAGARNRRAAGEGQLSVEATLESKVGVGQFYGIEIEEFPARIAETAMHLMDHLANLELSAEFGDYYVRFPIQDTAHVLVGNALRIDWSTLLPPSQCTYLFGNPPFVGISLRSASQTADLELVWQRDYHGSMDYVTGWYCKAIDYIGSGNTRAAFVSTNSICQGEQVAPLWAPVLSAGFRIDFAHRTFAWTSEARGKAAVHCIIVGFSNSTSRAKRVLYYYVTQRGEPAAREVAEISPYLIPGAPVLVQPRRTPLNPALGDVAYGNKPSDGGHLIVEPEDYDDVVADSQAAKYLRPFIGARELLYGEERWCLWLTDVDPSDVRRSPLLRGRIEAVRKFREASKAQSTREAAETPTLFRQIAQPKTSYLAIPSHSSETRAYFPVQRYDRNVICSNANFLTPDPDGMIFALMSSAIFMTWLRTVGGALKSDLRFNKLLVWNTLPVPRLSEKQRLGIVAAGEGILRERERYEASSLAVLYDKTAMPVGLRKAHHALDRAVGSVYGLRDFTDETERQAALFQNYVELTNAGAFPSMSPNKSARKRLSPP